MNTKLLKDLMLSIDLAISTIKENLATIDNAFVNMVIELEKDERERKQMPPLCE